MVSPQEFEKIFEMDRLAAQDGKTYGKRRFLYARILEMLPQRLFIGIAGLRGTGKTILLRQLRSDLEHSLYLSADALSPAPDLFELAKLLNSRHGITRLLIDEIHYQPAWQQALKKIFDFLPVKVIFTSSASIEVVKSRYDLSRRVLVVHLPPFSFREYLLFKHGLQFDVLTLRQILERPNERYQTLYQYEGEFGEFCQFGALPAYLAAPQPQTIQNLIQKVIEQDLRLIAKLDAQDLAHIRDILRFIAGSNVEVCGFSSIARNTGVSRYKAREYLELLQSASVLRIVMPHGANVMAEPKVLFALPLRAALSAGVDAERLRGAQREEFFLQHASAISSHIAYLKDMRGQKRPDYLLHHRGQKIVFEIGGAGKRDGQLKSIRSERRVVLNQPGNPQNGIPLLLFGFLY